MRHEGTVLGEDVFFRGNLSFRDSLLVNGKLQGTIETSGHLIIGPTGIVEADIKASQVSVQGLLQGTVSVAKKIDLQKNSVFRGDIRTPDLQVESGSTFQGNCIMG